MKIRNDQDRDFKNVEIGDVVFISSVRYYVYAITNSSIKLESRDEKIPAGLKRKDFCNKNTFAKRYFFNKVRSCWDYLRVRSMPNLDYM